MNESEWRGGLAPHYDYMLAARPDDPAMRESASIWLFEENGEFASALRARSVQLNNVVAIRQALNGNLVVYLR